MIRIIGLLLINIVSFQVNATSIADEYIDRYKEIAVSEMHRTGIPASIKLAQGLLESDWGRSELARKANNHFGIKCGGRWNGDGYYINDDDRNKHGKIIPSCFRVFNSSMESYIAHSEFLTSEDRTGRYAFLFDLDISDYKSWAKGLKTAGYATDRKYPAKLITIIEKYHLHRLDEYLPEGQPADLLANEQPPSSSIKSSSRLKQSENKSSYKVGNYTFSTINDLRMTTAHGGESLEELARKTGSDVEDLMKINEEYGYRTRIMAPGEIVFFKRKKRSNKNGNDFHQMKEGETMWDIAQMYGIKLNNLYAKNKMPKGAEPLPDQNIYISKAAPKGKRPSYTKHPRRNSETEFLFAVE